MREPLIFFVPGIPQPAGSKKAFVLRKGGAYTGRAVIVDANDKSKPWQRSVQATILEFFANEPLQPFDGPIRLIVEFRLPRPKGHYRTGKNASELRPGAPPFPTTKPDATKLLRGLEDALTGIVWKDDSQIVTQIVRKRYHDSPGAAVEIREATSALS